MYHISVRNLYIGKIGIDLQIAGNIQGIRIKGAASLDPTILVGELFTPNLTGYEPDYYLRDGYWNPKDNTFLINPMGTELYTLWITGVPLESSLKDYLLPHNLYNSTYRDSHRIYLFQITPQ